jgi:uncharacterized membrane protein YfhO
MFEYLGILIAVILGLALTHLVRGLSRLIHNRRTAKIWWPHALWTVNILIFVLGVWWGMFWWNSLHEWTIQQFFFIAGYCTILFLLSSMLYPPECPDDIDYERYFLDNKNWFFSIQLVAWLFDIAESLAKDATHLRNVPPQYVAFFPVVLAICVTGLVSKNRRVHAFLAVAWLVAVLSYLTLTALDKIVAG